MKNYIRLSIILGIAMGLFARAAQADLNEETAGARAAAMAGAFTAVADDVNAINYNPAGLTQIQKTQISAQSGQFLKGLTDDSEIKTQNLALVQPLGSFRGTLGLGYQTFHASRYFNDRIVSLAYAGKIKMWSAGLTVKQLHRQYRPDIYAENALNDSGVSTGQPDPLFSNHNTATDNILIDVGALTRLGTHDRFSVGLAVLNINSPDISLGGVGEKIPRTFKAGLAFHPEWGVISTELQRAKRLSNEMDRDVSFGIERIFPLAGMGFIGLQGGYKSGSRGFKACTAGTSFRFSTFGIDYSFEFPLNGLKEAGSTQRVALMFSLGQGICARPAASLNNYQISLIYYSQRKAAGASAQERLKLLHEIYIRYGQHGIDMSWFSKELAAL